MKNKHNYMGFLMITISVSALEGYPGYPRIPQYFKIYSMKFTKKIPKILCIKVGYPNMKKLTHSLYVAFRPSSLFVAPYTSRQGLRKYFEIK